MTKQLLGQFYTTHYKHILQNMVIPDNVSNIVEPFAGNGDLLNFIDNDKNKYVVRCYDIDSKKDYIIKQDTLLYPPDLDGAFVITNPPYLARNKCVNKEVFDKYNTNDLYKCFIQILINSDCNGGILIVPLNFICSIRKNDIDLRRNFMQKYSIVTLNIFEEQVFDDTSYTVCCFQFTIKKEDIPISCFIYPSKIKINIELNVHNNYTIGGEVYNLTQGKTYKIERATKLIKPEFFTNILAKCIDDSVNNKICLSMVDDKNKNKYIDNTPNLTARSYAILVIEPKLSLLEQQLLVDKFNLFINENRTKYNSLFLTNYRESKTIARKRISFSLVYEVCNFILHQ